MAGGGHRAEPYFHRRRLAPGAGRQSREPVPRRARPGAPRRAGRGHCPGAAGPRPRGRLPGRIPRAVLRARALGDGVHRQRDLRGQGPCHRRRRAAGGAAGERPRGSPALRRGDHTACTDRIRRKKAPFPARKECFLCSALMYPAPRLPAPRCPLLQRRCAGLRQGRAFRPCSRCTG